MIDYHNLTPEQEQEMITEFLKHIDEIELDADQKGIGDNNENLQGNL